MARRVRAIVSGIVQGVSYRATALAQARRLGLVGWVKNRHDGSVELEAQGSPEVVDELLAWCRRGPRAAHVEDVVVEELPASQDAEPDFDIAY